MDGFLENLKLLLSALGYKILQEVMPKEQSNTAAPLFTCEGKSALATGRMTNDGFVVYEGSTASSRLSNTAIERNYDKVIDKLLSNGYLKKTANNLYIFIKDYVFNSSSAAASIVLGHGHSGKEVWKTEKGKKLKDIYEK